MTRVARRGVRRDIYSVGIVSDVSSICKAEIDRLFQQPEEYDVK
jgi:hypothetical protein